MHRYYFHLKDGCGGYTDSTGVCLPSEDAARDYAVRVGVELMKNRERKARHWRIHVHGEQGQLIFEIPLITLDKTLSHLSPSHKEAMEQLSHRCYALREAIEKARAVRNQARALMAKSRGQPYLAADHGESILSGL
jgi:hypothetical protein